MNFVSTMVGLTMIGGSGAKLLRIPAYQDLVEGLAWTETERRRIGAAEFLGGALMLFQPTRRLGSGIVLAASGAALSVELRSGQTQLAGARAGLMLAALLVAAAG